MALALAACGALLGYLTRSRLPISYTVLVRLNFVLLLAPLSLLAGWTARLQFHDLTAAVLLLLAEAIGWTVAYLYLLRTRGRAARGLATGCLINTGLWAMPVAAAISPTALAFVILFDQGLYPLRGSLIFWLMRSGAPTPQTRATALTDYLPTAALLAGLLLQLVGVTAPAGATELLVPWALVAAACGFFLLAQAWPEGRPSLSREAVLLAVLRLSLAPLILGAAALLGLAIPAGAWVLACACSWFNFLATSRLYGYETDLAAGTITLSLTGALLLLPPLLFLL